MQCPDCLTFNEGAATFCNQCGAHLARTGGSSGTSRGRIGAILGVVALALVAVLAFVFRPGGAPPEGRGGGGGASRDPVPAVSAPEGSPRENAKPESPVTNGVQLAPVVPVPAATGVSVPLEWVVFEDSWEHPISRLVVPVVGGRWMAIPRRQVLGASRWRFAPGRDQETVVVGGIWRPEEPLGLWTLEDGVDLEGPGLEPFDPADPLVWVPLEGGARRRDLRISSTSASGPFLHDDAVTLEPGLLLQGSAVVGWSFGKALPGAWLWAGEPGKALRREIWVEGFYSQTYGRGREEKFAEALAEGRDQADLPAQLSRFAEGWRLDTRLDAEETPEYVTGSRILPEMLRLCDRLRQTDPGVVSRELDDAVLLAAGDTTLFLHTLMDLRQAEGPGTALDLALRLEGSLVPADSPAHGSFEQLLQRFYVDGLQLLLDQVDVQTAWTIHVDAQRRFPDDAEIHLRGVEIALVDGDWREAESRIDRRTYPLELADLEKLLRGKISELKALEGKIVIRFRPGARIIPTRARLNRRVDQDYLIDTGASITTIPTATQRQLGIRITPDTPRRRVNTAGGEVIAYEVVLSTIEIGGWEVENLAVLVLDLPGQEQVGLLGLNYLRHFRMDLKTDDGILLLEPL